MKIACSATRDPAAVRSGSALAAGPNNIVNHLGEVANFGDRGKFK
jgi:hypothetical protein